jgi:hypothetical protein
MILVTAGAQMLVADWNRREKSMLAGNIVKFQE